VNSVLGVFSVRLLFLFFLLWRFTVPVPLPTTKCFRATQNPSALSDASTRNSFLSGKFLPFRLEPFSPPGHYPFFFFFLFFFFFEPPKAPPLSLRLFRTSSFSSFCFNHWFFYNEDHPKVASFRRPRPTRHA